MGRKVTALDHRHGPATLGGTIAVLSAAENDARRIESHLRNAGHGVRVLWQARLEQLEELLAATPPELVLCTEGLAEAPCAEVTELSARLVPGLPVLWLNEQPSAGYIAGALASGAVDVVSAGGTQEMKRLERVCVRELLGYAQRRELTRLRGMLADAESHGQQLLAAVPDAVAYVQEGILTRTNPAFATLLGFDSAEALMGQPLMDFVAPSYQSAIKQHLKGVAKGRLDGEQLNFAVVHREGQLIEVRARWSRTTVEREPAIELNLRPEGREAAPENQTSPGSPPGRLGFVQALHEKLAAKTSAQRVIAFLVVDGFAAVEERMGLMSAEQAMQQLYDFVRARLAKAPALVRFSTDEIAALLEAPRGADFEGELDVLRKDIAAQLFRTDAHEAHLTVTLLGFPLGEESADSALQDVCREARKLSRQGGNRACLLGPAAKSSLMERELARRAAQVKSALADNRMRIAFQAIASLEGDPRQHQDVLVRMVDESGQELLAGEFIGAAEKFGLVRDIDRWVVARALELLYAPAGDAPDGRTLFVRLSEDTLKNGDDFVAWLKQQPGGKKLPKDTLVFELQEHILQNHIGKAQAFCETLRKLGAEISVSQYGGGHHSGQVLQNVPARYVKFHGQFAQRFGDPQIQKRMHELLDAAKAKGAKTICSHIEDANLMAKLWQLGVNYIQGKRVREPEVVKL